MRPVITFQTEETTSEWRISLIDTWPGGKYTRGSPRQPECLLATSWQPESASLPLCTGLRTTLFKPHAHSWYILCIVTSPDSVPFSVAHKSNNLQCSATFCGVITCAELTNHIISFPHPPPPAPCTINSLHQMLNFKALHKLPFRLSSHPSHDALQQLLGLR